MRGKRSFSWASSLYLRFYPDIRQSPQNPSRQLSLAADYFRDQWGGSVGFDADLERRLQSFARGRSMMWITRMDARESDATLDGFAGFFQVIDADVVINDGFL